MAVLALYLFWFLSRPCTILTLLRAWIFALNSVFFFRPWRLGTSTSKRIVARSSSHGESTLRINRNLPHNPSRSTLPKALAPTNLVFPDLPRISTPDQPVIWTWMPCTKRRFFALSGWSRSKTRRSHDRSMGMVYLPTFTIKNQSFMWVIYQYGENQWFSGGWSAYSFFLHHPVLQSYLILPAIGFFWGLLV